MERIAHRGAKREFPENSIPAFQRAFERGADAVELDVHATRDGVVVVHHDATLGGHAGGLFGRPIAELTASELSAHELSPGVTIPTLAQVLGVTPGDRSVYVELKGAGIEEAVAAVLATTAARCAVHSFDHDAVATMKALVPMVPRGILFDNLKQDVVAAMLRAGARDVWPEWKLIDAPLVERIHAAGGRVIAWTVNSRAAAADLAGLGVDGLCTDDVRLLDVV